MVQQLFIIAQQLSELTVEDNGIKKKKHSTVLLLTRVSQALGAEGFFLKICGKVVEDECLLELAQERTQLMQLNPYFNFGFGAIQPEKKRERNERNNNDEEEKKRVIQTTQKCDMESAEPVPESDNCPVTQKGHINKHCQIEGCDNKLISGKNWSRHLNKFHSVKKTKNSIK